MKASYIIIVYNRSIIIIIIYITKIMITIILISIIYLPKTWSVVEELVVFALFLAVHLYIPSIFFVIFCISRNNSTNESPSKLFSLVPDGSLPSLNVQVRFGVGTPVARQVKLTESPSITDWFIGDSLIWGETGNKKGTINLQSRFSRGYFAVIKCVRRFFESAKYFYFQKLEILPVFCTWE